MLLIDTAVVEINLVSNYNSVPEEDEWARAYLDVFVEDLAEEVKESAMGAIANGDTISIRLVDLSPSLARDLDSQGMYYLVRPIGRS